MSKNTKLALWGATLLSALATTTALAVPAKSGIHQVKQADGTTLSIQLHGDESMHFRTTSDGYLITPDPSGNYLYLQKDGAGNLIPSTVRAVDPSRRTATQLSSLSTIGITAEQLTTEDRSRMRALLPELRITSPMAATGKKKGIVLLVGFSDVRFQIPNAHSEFSNMLNTPGYNNSYGQVGSANDYFLDNSMGQFDPDFHVIGPINLPSPLANYGGSDLSGNRDRDPAGMVRDALAMADLSALNMAEFDSNGDGFVDNLFVFYAGYSEAEGAVAESIWPHAASLKLLLSLPDNLLPQKDGVKFNDYACGSELSGISGTRMSGIGTFCHEFAHILGLPDTYDTNGSAFGQAFGLDAWSLMANGPYNGNGNIPAGMNAWERWKSGWLTLTELNDADDYTLAPLQESNQGYILKNSANANEYFVLENRQQTMWDRAIPSHGMLIYHLDFTSTTPWLNNQVNANASRQCFELEAADNIQSKATLAGDPFPGSFNKREFTDTSSPSSRLWSGQLMNKPITAISEIEGEIHFKLSGGFNLAAPTALSATDILGNGFTLNWSPVERATHYLVDIYTESGVDNGKVTQLWDFASGTMPAELSTQSFAANNNRFGNAAPSISTTFGSREITTPNYNFPLEALSFWYDVEGSNDEWTIRLEAFSNGSWVTFQTLTATNSGATGLFETTELPANTLRVRIGWTRGATAKTLSVDDLTLRYHDQAIVRSHLAGYENRSVGNNTSLIIEGAAPLTHYNCVVRSANVANLSSNSQILEVTTSESTSLGGDEENAIRVYRVAANTIAIQNRSNQAEEAAIYHTTGSLHQRSRIEMGETTLTLPNGGIYLVQIGNRKFKVAL